MYQHFDVKLLHGPLAWFISLIDSLRDMHLFCTFSTLCCH